MESEKQSTPKPPPFEPLLTPEGAKKRAPRKKKAKGPAVIFGNAKTEAPEPPKVEPPKPPEPPAEAELEKFTIEEVFDDGWEDLNLEKAIRCTAFLLKYCSEIGNDSVNGFAAFGLGHVLDTIADRTNSAIQRTKCAVAAVAITSETPGV